MKMSPVLMAAWVTPRTHSQTGASLIMVMLILIVVSGLGIGAAQISMMSERSARNDRDTQIAWQAAEAALMDAEFDIRGPLASTRRANFGPNGSQPDLTLFDIAGCGTAGNAIGLCARVDDAVAATTKQKWLTADFTIVGSTAPTAKYGQYTLQTYVAGASGVQPSKEPRYIIEPIRDYGFDRDKTKAKDVKYMYRITAMGFGPRPDIQAVAQMILRP